MILLRNREFSQMDSKEEFERKNKEHREASKNAALHGAATGIDSVLSYKFINAARKSKNGRGLAIAGAVASGIGALGHGYSFDKNVGKIKAFNKDKKYMNRFNHEIDKEEKKDDKNYEEMIKAKKRYEEAEKKYYNTGWGIKA